MIIFAERFNFGVLYMAMINANEELIRLRDFNVVHYSDSSYKTFITHKGVGISTCGQASFNNKHVRRA